MSALAAPGEAREALRRWLLTVCALLVAMVALGGLTRLTGSGLSIVEWRPVTGVVPPLSDRAWEEAFAAYRRSPQGLWVNAEMSLQAFKGIYLWEYLHRLLGRVIGVAVALPLLFFIWRRKISRALAWRLGGIFLLGGAQGALGWFMVKSGLLDRPAVSHLRLAAHLGLALLLLGAVAWLALELGPHPARSRLVRVRPFVFAFAALVPLQIVYGALTAGLHAGLAARTFPTWNGHLAPPEALALTPLWRNALSNPSTVQYLHRGIGTLLLIALLVLCAVAARQPLERRARILLRALLAVTLLQYGLGVATVKLGVPLWLAALHQLGACALFLFTVALVHAARRPARPLSLAPFQCIALPIGSPAPQRSPR